jgi:thiamine phosphate synthase YjbQ (UPF0047 family)
MYLPTLRCLWLRDPDDYLKRQIMGREVVVAITRGKLDFGAWEQIFYGELMDGGASGCW